MFKKWITNGAAAPFYARKSFLIDKPVFSATAKVCGLGQFLFSVNGQKMGDHELDPAWTDYNKLVQYVTFDVTSALQQGENVLGVEVGNGWYHKMNEHYTFAFPSFMPPNPNGYHPYAKVLVLALELTIVYADGTEENLSADESFKVKKHPTIMSNVYGSETIDNRLNVPGWNKPGYDDSTWVQAVLADEKDVPKGMLENQFQPAVKVIQEYQGKLIGRVNGRDIYDFGQNMSGLLDFEIKGSTGGIVNIYPAEKLGVDGDVDQVAKNWITVDSCIRAIVGQEGEWEHCRMKFTYFAGRLMAVETKNAEIRNLKGCAITSAYQEAGSFRCDDERYEQIYDMIEKTVEANMVGVHTDCPTIERFAWQEPNHLMAGSIFYMKECKALWEKFFGDIRCAQHTAQEWFNDMTGGKYYPGEGTIPAQCPCYDPNVLPVPGLGDMYDIIAWGSTAILGVYWHYLFYGDKQVVEDNYDTGMRYLAHLKSRVNDDGFINYGLGDWGNPRNELARENIETAFLYADAITLAKFAALLCKSDDQAMLEQYAQQVKQNYNEKLLVKNENLGGYCYKCWDYPDQLYLTQAAQALPLFWGMIPEEKKADVVKALRYTLERDGSFICGEVGLPYVIQMASQNGMNDLICRYILKEEHPSYYAFILDGETTLGEYWEHNPRSHCHDMMGHIIEWYYNGIAGIRPTQPGFTAVSIRPYLPESIHEFTCSYHSASGEITVSVEEDEKEIRLNVHCDSGITFQVDTSELAACGKHVSVMRV